MDGNKCWKRKKSEKEIKKEKSDRILLGVATWAAFYRHNPQRFVKDYLNVHLKLFQKIILFQMMLNDHFMADRPLLHCAVHFIPKNKNMHCFSDKAAGK